MKWVSNLLWQIQNWTIYYLNSIHIQGIHSPFVFDFHQNFWKKHSRQHLDWEQALQSWLEQRLISEEKKSIFAEANAHEITDDQWHRLQEMAQFERGTVLIKNIRSNRISWLNWKMLSEIFTLSIDTGKHGILVAKKGQEKEYFWLK